MGTILFPENLRNILGEDGAKELVELLNSITDGIEKDTISTPVDKFNKRLSEIKAGLLQWMFIFGIGQIIVITGLLTYFS